MEKLWQEQMDHRAQADLQAGFELLHGLEEKVKGKKTRASCRLDTTLKHVSPSKTVFIHMQYITLNARNKDP